MSIRILFAGDIFSEEGKLEITLPLLETIQSYDIRCCNLEAPAISYNAKSAKKVGPTLKQESEVIGNISKCGFNLIALANNHIMDYGAEGLEKTIEEIKRNNLKYFGASTDYGCAYKEFIIEKEGMRIGIINCGENGFGCADEDGKVGYAWMLSKKTFLNIKKIKQQGIDILLAFTHCGLEGINFPLQEWRNVFFQFIDAGVDVVINAHPHVPQGWENYKNGRIYYSIGNFAWNRKRECNSFWSYIVGIECDHDKKMKFIEHIIEGKGEKVTLSNNSFFRSALLNYCEIIYNEQKYHAIIERIVNEYWEKYYTNYIRYAAKILPNNCMKNYLINIYRVITRKQAPDLFFVP